KVLKDVKRLAEAGYRSLLVAVGNGVSPDKPEENLVVLGILPLRDPPRDDAGEMVRKASEMGVKVKMVTGDSASVALVIAKAVGIGERVLVGDALSQLDRKALLEKVEKIDVFADVLPEHKFTLVRALKELKHFVGVTGDGVNDVPALRTADVGIAVANATDATKAAADVVLTEPGISVIIHGIREGRRIFQRMQRYALYRIAESIRVVLLVTICALLLGFFPLTPVQVVILAMLNDFSILSIATDRVEAPKGPQSWHMSKVLTVSSVLGVTGLISSFILIWYLQDLPQNMLQTAVFLKLCVAGQMTLAIVRTTHRPWVTSRPSNILGMAMIGAVTIASLVSYVGIVLTPLPFHLVAFVWIYAFGWMWFEDGIKMLIYRLLEE
ncbi:MAG: HAD-IC family P-type ATPase, partial [Methermicoccaceae archaeon]